MYGRTPKAFRMRSLRKVNREEWRDKKAAASRRSVRQETANQLLGELWEAAQSRRV